MGSLSGSTVVNTSAVNLSSPAQTDWIQFPQSATSPNRKSGGGSTISLPTAIGTGVTLGGYGPDARSVTWTDGTPTTSATSGDGIFTPASGSAVVGNGLQFTVPADTTTRTVVIAWGMYGGDTGANTAAAKLVATLSDGSATAVTHTPTGVAAGVSTDYLTTLTYGANSASQTLNLAVTLTTVNAGAGNFCNVTVQAAKVLASASNSALASGTLGGLNSSTTAASSRSALASGTLGAFASSATAVIAAAAVSMSSLGGLSSQGVASQSRIGSAASVMGALSSSGTGVQSRTSTANSALGAFSSSVIASNTSNTTAVAASVLGALSSSGQAAQASSAAASPALGALASGITGTQHRSAAANSSLSLLAAGSATQNLAANVGSTLGALSSSASVIAVPNNWAIASGALGALQSAGSLACLQSAYISAGLGALSSSVEARSIPPIILDADIFHVSAENRLFTVAGETRTYVVLPETRVFKVG